jgi:hypothetical protein
MENYPIGVLLHNDPGHISKNLKSKLAAIFGKGNRYGEFVGRIHRWFNYYWKKSEQEVETETQTPSWMNPKMIEKFIEKMEIYL